MFIYATCFALIPARPSSPQPEARALPLPLMTCRRTGSGKAGLYVFQLATNNQSFALSVQLSNARFLHHLTPLSWRLMTSARFIQPDSAR